jgi:Ser/Thr protein kinase RdoA (MazF antagonist)
MEIDWAERRRHVTSLPSPDGLLRLAKALDADDVSVVRRLGGGVVAATHLLRVDRHDGTHEHVVLKRFPGDAISAKAADEHARLACAIHAGVPTPVPLALDAEGEWFGVAALVMSALPGEPVLHPVHPDRWLRLLAETLVTIHATTVNQPTPSVLTAPATVDTWQPWHEPADERDRATAHAIVALRRSLPELPRVFSHCDYHPGNVLFVEDADEAHDAPGSSRLEMTGVVDWAFSLLLPRHADVAQCRSDLALHPGGDAPDAFLAHYEAAYGTRLEGLAAWDVLRGDHMRKFGPQWVEAFAESGVSITAEHITATAEHFVDAALARL